MSEAWTQRGADGWYVMGERDQESVPLAGPFDGSDPRLQLALESAEWSESARPLVEFWETWATWCEEYGPASGLAVAEPRCLRCKAAATHIEPGITGDTYWCADHAPNYDGCEQLAAPLPPVSGESTKLDAEVDAIWAAYERGAALRIGGVVLTKPRAEDLAAVLSGKSPMEAAEQRGYAAGVADTEARANEMLRVGVESVAEAEAVGYEQGVASAESRVQLAKLTATREIAKAHDGYLARQRQSESQYQRTLDANRERAARWQRRAAEYRELAERALAVGLECCSDWRTLAESLRVAISKLMAKYEESAHYWREAEDVRRVLVEWPVEALMEEESG